MQTDTKSPEFLMLVRGNQWTKQLSPAEIQEVMANFADWMEDLTRRGIWKGGQPLHDEGKVVTGRGERMVADGPFAESKEAVGGYFLLRIDTMEEAVEIAKSCPMVGHGVILEVRPVAESCPHLAEHYERQKREGAAGPTAVLAHA